LRIEVPINLIKTGVAYDTKAITPLRQRMIEDMNARKLCAGTQRGHILSCKRFAEFLKRFANRQAEIVVRIAKVWVSRRVRNGPAASC
jgi:hypothetical protein